MHPAEHAARDSSKPAVVMAATGETMDYGRLDALSNAGAWQLRAFGLARGDVVATLFANAPEVFAFGWADQRSGLYRPPSPAS